MAEEYFVGRETFSVPVWHMLNCTGINFSGAPLQVVERTRTYVYHRCPACPDWFYWESK